MEMSWKRWKPVKKNKVTVLAFLNLLKKFKPFVIQMLKSYPPQTTQRSKPRTQHFANPPNPTFCQTKHRKNFPKKRWHLFPTHRTLLSLSKQSAIWRRSGPSTSTATTFSRTLVKCGTILRLKQLVLALDRLRSTMGTTSCGNTTTPHTTC